MVITPKPWPLATSNVGGSPSDRLCNDLQKRGRISDTRPENRELAEILVDEYIHFPPPEAGQG